MSRAYGREYGLALALMAVAAIGVVVAYRSTWITAAVPVFSGTTAPTTNEQFSGTALVGLGGAAGWVSLAAVGGVIATRSWGRTVVGGIAFLAGAAAGVSALAFWFSRGPLVEAALDGGEAISVQGNLWWLVAALGGLGVMITGLMTLLRGRMWPALGRRYERNGGAVVAPTSATEMWDALDRGEDPTRD
jgi:uncharacterized membrane protein (TIGR02234 family)